MRLRKTTDGVYWEMSEAERRAAAERQEGRAPAPVRPAEVGSVDSKPVALAPDSDSWIERLSDGRFHIHPMVTQKLAESKRAMFSSRCGYLPDSLVHGFKALEGEFASLTYQEFGFAGSPGFFSGRTIRSDYRLFTPGDIQNPDTADTLLDALIKGFLRALPDHQPNVARYVNWMLSRHAGSVEAMPAHRDDVAWLAQMSIGRTADVRGGAVQLLTDNGVVVEESLLAQPFDGYIVRDEHYMHAVTAMSISGNGHRDVIVLRISDCIGDDE
ncbi:2OG-Fe dioxygenase family protein [Mesorhizobium mediterraneum]|uniref:2OG-Fe dioxygenase family protein n=1 Tax=Mesorhizobium mediterraneum TaxID=43617 RepID=UPI00177C447D|nr:2OG-Fe dioxygenase family protein [Mesorhizobium mediterraneum]